MLRLQQSVPPILEHPGALESFIGPNELYFHGVCFLFPRRAYSFTTYSVFFICKSVCVCVNASCVKRCGYIYAQTPELPKGKHSYNYNHALQNT